MAPPKLDSRILTALGLSLMTKGCVGDEDSAKETYASACLSMVQTDVTEETATESCLSIAYETGDTGLGPCLSPLETGDSGLMDTGMDSGGGMDNQKAVSIQTNTATDLRKVIRDKLMRKGILPSDLAEKP